MDKDERDYHRNGLRTVALGIAALLLPVLIAVVLVEVL